MWLKIGDQKYPISIFKTELATIQSPLSKPTQSQPQPSPSSDHETKEEETHVPHPLTRDFDNVFSSPKACQKTPFNDLMDQPSPQSDKNIETHIPP